MRGIAIASLLLCACPGSKAGPPIERATPVDPAPPPDAAPAIEEPPPPPDAAIEEPPAKLSPLDQLPPSGENPLPELPDQALIDERLYLAFQHAGEPLGLSLLLDIANAAGGVHALDQTRWDDRFASQWDQPAFQMIVTLEPPDAPAPMEMTYEDPAYLTLVCPKGTKQKLKDDAVWCQRKNGVKHGPYHYYEMGYDEGEGTAQERGDYVEGKKWGMWYWSESFSGWSFGAYKKGVKHGLWEEGERETYRYVAYVDGKAQGLVTTKSGQGDDVTVGEHRYDAGVLHGEFREWETNDPYALVLEGAYDHGKKTGEWHHFDETGAVRAVERWTADVRDGDYAFFDASGSVLATGHLDAGTGEWIEYDALPGVRAQGSLVKGVKQGKWGERDEFGEGWETGDYKDGKRTGPWVRYATFAGDKVWGGDYVDGLRSGAWIWLDAGAVRVTGAFARGKPTGHWDLTTQTMDLKNGKLLKLDGKKPTKAEREAFESWSPDNPEPLFVPSPDVMY